jgi:uncharacterized protein YyaL (SSP411 family)
MLYDQAMLMLASGELYASTREEEFASLADGIFAYLERDMLSPEGAYYAAEDADSEGEEGKFYVWSKAEIESVLGSELGELFCYWYRVSEEGNFREEASGELSGKNVLHFRGATETGYNWEIQEKLSFAKRRLFEQRRKRVRPMRDEKILSDWNGLVIGALARSGRFCARPDFIEAAERVATFLLTEMRDSSSGELYHSRGYGYTQWDSFLSDYAYLAFGCIELYEATFKHEYLQAAREFTELSQRLFSTESGYVLSAQPSQPVFAQVQEVFDGATPSSNSMMLYALIRLGTMLGDTEKLNEADRLAKALEPHYWDAPAAHCWSLCALDLALGTTPKLSFIPASSSEGDPSLLDEARRYYHPRLQLCHAADLMPEATSAEREAWRVQLCWEGACETAAADWLSLERRLRETSGGRRTVRNSD